MKKRIFAILLAISMIAGLLPSMVFAAPAGPARFLFTDNAAGNAPALEVIVNEGDAPVYLYSNGSDWFVKPGASVEDYNIKITYNVGENPKLYLNKAHLSAYGDARAYDGITIGSATDNTYNNVSVDVIAENGSSWLSNQKSYGAPAINSYIDGTLTLSSEGNGQFNIGCDGYGIRHGALGFINAKGDLVLKNAKINASIKFATRPYFRSESGNITVDGGTLTLTKKGDASTNYGAIFQAKTAGKKILIQNGANVTFTDTIGGSTVFDGATEIKDASVGVTFTTTGVIFSEMPTLAYTNGYAVTADGNNYNNTNFGAVLATGYNTIQNFSIAPNAPVELPRMQFIFKGLADPIVINEGGDDIYLKTDGGVVSGLGTSSDYHIMISFPSGGRPTVTLNGAVLKTAQEEGTSPFIIGDAADEKSASDVDIIVAADSSLVNDGRWGPNLITSNITGTLKITSTGAAKLTMTKQANGTSAIDAKGSILLENANIDMGASWNGNYAFYLWSRSGNITVSGGNLNIVTTNGHATSSRPVFRTSGGGDVVFENGANVLVDLTNGINAHGVFEFENNAAGEGTVIFRNATVSIATSTGARVFGNANGDTVVNGAVPVIEGYAEGYVAMGNGETYDAAKYATYTSFSIATNTVRSAKFGFIDSLDSTAPSSNLVVNIAEGDAPIYLKVANGVATATGASETDYNIKITFEAGKNPTLYLKGANLKSYGDARGTNAIILGSATATDSCNNVSVDIVVEADTSLTYKNSWGDPNIKSYITGALTITSTNDAVLTMESRFGGSNHGAIDAIGDINLKNAKVVMNGTVKNGDVGYYIHSITGNITVDGGTLDITTAEGKNNRGVLWTEAEGKNITIANAAVNITVKSDNCTAFKTAGKIIVKDASLAVVVSAADSKVSTVAPTIEGYAGGYTVKADNGAYDETKIAEYKSFNIKPYQAPKARFVFQNFLADPFAIEVIIEQGGAPVFLKTVGGIVTAEGASADDYQIKITFENGKSPNLYLKGAEIKTHGDAKGDHAILIGSETATDIYNDNNVNIVIQRNSTILNNKTYGSPLIKSYITGALTITKEKGSLSLSHMCSPSGLGAAVEVVGDLVLKNVNLKMESHHSGYDRYNYFRSSNGNIIVNAGKLTITTNGDGNLSEKPTHKRIFMTEADGKDIIFENGASVTITVRNSAKVFGTKGNVIFDNATVKINVTGGGSIFGDVAPVIKNYAEGTTALGDDATYDPAKFAEYKTFSIEGGDPVIGDDYDDDFIDGTGNGSGSGEGSGDGTGSGSGTGTGSGSGSGSGTGTGTGTGGNPNTGDNTNLALLSTLVVISALGMVALVVIGKKRFTV